MVKRFMVHTVRHCDSFRDLRWLPHSELQLLLDLNYVDRKYSLIKEHKNYVS